LKPRGEDEPLPLLNAAPVAEVGIADAPLRSDDFEDRLCAPLLRLYEVSHHEGARAGDAAVAVDEDGATLS